MNNYNSIQKDCHLYVVPHGNDNFNQIPNIGHEHFIVSQKEPLLLFCYLHLETTKKKSIMFSSVLCEQKMNENKTNSFEIINWFVCVCSARRK